MNAAALGIEEVGTSLFKHQISGSEIIEGRFKNKAIFDQLKKCDAIIFASPTYMGGQLHNLKLLQMPVVRPGRDKNGRESLPLA